MRRVFRPLAVFSIASGVSLAVALQLLVGGARGQGPTDFGASSLVPRYELAELELVDPTLFHLSESYVDKSRLDWDAMFDAALDAIERRVPVCMFTREPGGNLVSIEVGEYRTVLEVPPIERRQDLQSELKKVATLLAEHLDERDIPNHDDLPQPFALVEYALINGMLSTLDPHSVLLPPEDAREMDVENQGVFGGIGIAIGADLEGGHLVIDYTMEGKAADRAGLRRKDHIIRIDGESTINMTLDDAVDRLRGPVGAAVKVVVLRENESAPLEFRIIRELISPKPVVGELVSGTDIGYLRIEAFHEKVEHRLHGELAELTRAAGGKLGGLILDLRGNPGGFLNQAVKVADTFLESGDIVSTVDGSGRKTDQEKARPSSSQPRYPIVVLVDANSASASEIVAGALRFNERAAIVGTRTFGKGSVQNLHPMVDNSKLKLTISRYLTPGDRSIQGMGIPADIELISSAVPESPDDPLVRMFHHEREMREADLDHSLERSTLVLDDPVYTLRYVYDDGTDRGGSVDLETDFFALFARDLLKAARGWRRADVLSAAHPVVYRYQRKANEELERRFQARGLDWSVGPETSPEALALDLTLDLGADGVLTAGQPERVGLVVTNRSAKPVYRLAAIASDGEVFAGREEFLFGRVGPGETARYEQTIELPAGWPAEEPVVRFELHDVSEQVIGSWEASVEVAARPSPHLAWRWSMVEKTGNGDGIADVGEQIAIKLELENRGSGPTEEPFARLRNRSGKALDPVVAILEPGELVAVQPRPVDAPETCDTPKQLGCARLLDPGQQWAGEFVVELKAEVDEAWELELTLGDADAYDHAAVVRSGFYDWYSQHEELEIVSGLPLPSSEWRSPPVVRITRPPEMVAGSRRATVSGVVTSDTGVRHVMVFADQNKVFFESSRGDQVLYSVPFTADVELEPGSNVLSVLATDLKGFVTGRAAVSWYDDPDFAARNVEAPDGP